MRRSAQLPITAAVLFSLAMVLLAGSILLPTSPLPPAGLSVTDGTAVVHRFYAAVNEAIATGEFSRLRMVVAPTFVEENPLPGVRPGREGLEDYLAILHASVPDTRLVAEAVVAAADQVVARVEVRDGLEPASLRGIIVERAPVWGSVDVFRVAGGGVVARWGPTDGMTLTRPLAEFGLDFSAPAPRVVTMTRVALAPGAGWDASPAGPRLLYLETGALHVIVAGTDNAGDAPQDVMLSTRRSLGIPAGARVSMANAGRGAVGLLVVTFDVPQIPDWESPEPVMLPTGVSVETLAGGLATDVAVGPATLTLGQVTLGRKARLSLSSAAGPVIIAVDAGQLGLSAWGTAWQRRGRDGMSVETEEADLAAGDGLLLEPGGLVAIDNGGEQPVEALVLALGG